MWRKLVQWFQSSLGPLIYLAIHPNLLRLVVDIHASLFLVLLVLILVIRILGLLGRRWPEIKKKIEGIN
jgi:hypothetical protein